jgi:chaperonin GroES
MKLLQNRILVKPIKGEQVTTSGIILPASAKNKNTGKVLFTGLKVEVVEVGQVVKYHEHSGVEYTHNGEECLFLNEYPDVIAIL